MSTMQIDRETFLNIAQFLNDCVNRFYYSKQCDIKYHIGRVCVIYDISTSSIENLMCYHKAFKQFEPQKYESFGSYEKHTKNLSPVQVLKSLQAILYNTGLSESLNKHFQQFLYELSYQIVTHSKEYQSAIWG